MCYALGMKIILWNDNTRSYEDADERTKDYVFENMGIVEFKRNAYRGTFNKAQGLDQTYLSRFIDWNDPANKNISKIQVLGIVFTEKLSARYFVLNYENTINSSINWICTALNTRLIELDFFHKDWRRAVFMHNGKDADSKKVSKAFEKFTNEAINYAAQFVDKEKLSVREKALFSLGIGKKKIICKSIDKQVNPTDNYSTVEAVWLGNKMYSEEAIVILLYFSRIRFVRELSEVSFYNYGKFSDGSPWDEPTFVLRQSENIINEVNDLSNPKFELVQSEFILNADKNFHNKTMEPDVFLREIELFKIITENGFSINKRLDQIIKRLIFDLKTKKK